ncbi:methyltransferase domain-containing protein [Flammeovirga sp. SubArs3]|uniref:methyltransferase domain-containing protein n=1 Tax=Flammeovirga sp. SubArs3 TaxID=2995316 RepID=UPI00248B4AAC|nr:methyltransferase domain-containing protein [Flammeovirga sp. SubArs3]
MKVQRKKESNYVYDRRSLTTDYRHLPNLLKSGLKVLDIGCATGSITHGISEYVGPTGKVTGIDNTGHMIEEAQQKYSDVQNLEFIHCDLLEFNPDEKFDLIVGARVLQWISNPFNAVLKIKELLKPGGQVSILDYNHNRLEWVPQPPLSMLHFYQSFLKWRAEAGLNNAIGSELPILFKNAGFNNIEVISSNENYNRQHPQFEQKVKIWSEVAELEQLVKEGYIVERNRLQAIAEYNPWVEEKAISMTMFLNEVRATL